MLAMKEISTPENQLHSFSPMKKSPVEAPTSTMDSILSTEPRYGARPKFARTHRHQSTRVNVENGALKSALLISPKDTAQIKALYQSGALPHEWVQQVLNAEAASTPANLTTEKVLPKPEEPQEEFCFDLPTNTSICYESGPEEDEEKQADNMNRSAPASPLKSALKPPRDYSAQSRHQPYSNPNRLKELAADPATPVDKLIKLASQHISTDISPYASENRVGRDTQTDRSRAIAVALVHNPSFQRLMVHSLPNVRMTPVTTIVEPPSDEPLERLTLFSELAPLHDAQNWA